MIQSILLLGIALFNWSNAQAEPTAENQNSSSSRQSSTEVFMCPMHPHISQHEPGSCPICGMDLVPMQTESSHADASDDSIKITKASRILSSIETEKVKESIAFQILNAVGSIDFDEGRVSSITALTDGRIEKLYANFNGIQIKKGEHLAKIYSPALYSAQIEFIQAKRALNKMHKNLPKEEAQSSQAILLRNAQTKLRELGLSEKQIFALYKSETAKSRIIMDSHVTGTVIAKNVIEGNYVESGQVIYKVADLSTVWLLLDLFPEETAFLRFGLKVKAKIRSAPERDFLGRISFISPFIDKQSRTVRVRVEIPNPDGALRPGDIANASIRIPVGLKGGLSKIYDPDFAKKYISPMHPQETSPTPGKCPVCGMELISAKEFGYTANESDLDKVLTVPRNAVLSVGHSHAVFVEQENQHFVLRKIVKGPVVEGQRVVVFAGLQANETVASNGVFLIDSQMQLSGKTSLKQLAPEREETSTQKHEHQ